MSDPFDDLLAPARDNMAALRSLIDDLNINYIETAPSPFGVGLAVSWDGSDMTVVTIMGGGNERQVSFTSPVLADVIQDRLAILDACNSATRERAAYPVFLHDAEIGWDVLTQVTIPIGVVANVPDFLFACLRNPPLAAQEMRQRFIDAGLGGRLYEWSDDDIYRLFMRSML